jgi:hypothetical protein
MSKEFGCCIGIICLLLTIMFITGIVEIDEYNNRWIGNVKNSTGILLSKHYTTTIYSNCEIGPSYSENCCDDTTNYYLNYTVQYIWCNKTYINSIGYTHSSEKCFGDYDFSTVICSGYCLPIEQNLNKYNMLNISSILPIYINIDYPNQIYFSNPNEKYNLPRILCFLIIPPSIVILFYLFCLYNKYRKKQNPSINNDMNYIRL